MIECSLITGASSGIGEEFARQLAREGHNLLLVARREEKLQQLVTELQSNDVKVFAVRADLFDEESIPVIIQEIKKNNVFINYLVNNAGVGIQSAFLEKPVKEWASHVHLNIVRFIELTHALLPEMVTHSDGTIVNIASAGAFQALPWYSIYGSNKAFMLSFSEGLAEEVSPMKIQVTCICPGAVKTDFNRNAGIDTGRTPSALFMSSEKVVKLSLGAVKRGKRVYIPGLINKINVFAQRLLPRRMVTKIASRIYKPRG